MVRGVFVAVLLAATATFSGPPALGQAAARGFVRVRPDDVKWVSEVDAGGLSVQRATIHGDPSKPGIYVVRIKYPPGVMSRPHFHKEDRHAVVLQGTWWTGTGAEFAPEKTVPLAPGSYMMHPAGERHFDGAKDDEVILQLIGYGPSETTRLSKEIFGRSTK